MDQQQCTYITTDLCVAEFIKSSTSQDVISKKKRLIEKLDITTFNISSLKKEYEKIQAMYRLSGKKIS